MQTPCSKSYPLNDSVSPTRISYVSSCTCAITGRCWPMMIWNGGPLLVRGPSANSNRSNPASNGDTNELDAIGLHAIPFDVKVIRGFGGLLRGLTKGRRITHYPFRDRARMGEERWLQKNIRAACGIRAYGASVRYVTCIDCRQLIELRHVCGGAGYSSSCSATR